MMPRWPNALPQQHLQPADLGKQLIVVTHDAAAGSEQVDLTLQLLGNRHAAAVIPERRVMPLHRLVVQDQEVPNTLELEGRLSVVLVDVRLLNLALRQKRQQTSDGRLYQMNTGGFQRLHE